MNFVENKRCEGRYLAKMRINKVFIPQLEEITKQGFEVIV